MKSAAMFTILFCISFIAAAHAQTNGCALKKQEIETKLSYARQFHNDGEVARLEKALDGVNANCNDARLTSKRQADVAEKQAKVDKKTIELDNAKQTGIQKG